MDQSKSDASERSKELADEQPKWDYTSTKQNFFIGALVIGLNVLVVIAFALDRTVPAVHAFISGKPV